MTANGPAASPVEARIRTPLARVRGLGSAKEGSDHFWLQRMTAVANIVLVAFAVWLVVRLVGADYATVKAALGHPIVSLGLLLLILSATIHMRLGMQVVIEDYVHAEGWKVTCLMLNTFFAFGIGVASVYAIMKLSFGA
jgi:succinate dehydrogenase / fumarate reductase membrane anchor subunit